MKSLLPPLADVMFVGIMAAVPPPESRFVHLNTPVTAFFKNKPFGNGRLGAGLEGEVTTERIVFNESGV